MAIFNAIALLALAASAFSHPAVRRQVTELDDDYDWIIVGGGTAGLTVADRLTETFPDKKTLVIEYGDIKYAPGANDPPQAVLEDRTWVFSSLPNPDVLNKTALVLAGKTLGGSSAVNGQFFDRPSRWDFEAWNALLEAEDTPLDVKWDWEAMYPHFQKSVTFTEPSEEAVDEYGYTWDPTAWDNTTPIHASFPPFLWGDHHVFRSAWSDLGVPAVEECADGDKTGLCWIPISQHPVTARRSHSGLGHYAAVNESRVDNYHLLVRHQVVRLVWPEGSGPADGPPLVEVRDLSDDSLFNVSARVEVILSAGALHTPTVLLRSGIGPAEYLESEGIDVVLDLPGVGSNFQDHSGPGIEWDYDEPGDWSPMLSDMSDPDFQADALAGFDETPARGPYTLALSNSAIFISLPDAAPATHASIVSKIRAMVNDSSAASYLPPSYAADPTMVAGYLAQLNVLADFHANPDAPSLESPFSTGRTQRAINLHPLSRGTVRLDPEDHLAQPVLDYRAGSNPVDFDVYVAHLEYLRTFLASETMQGYGAFEVAPGEEVVEFEDLVAYAKQNMTFSYMHPCCTAAMLAKNKGGVVAPDLRVHGAEGVRVVDMSVFPLEPSSHLSAAAYALGEKAASILVEYWTEHLPDDELCV